MFSNAQKAISEAVELSKRFPDLPPREVVEHVNYVIGVEFIPNNHNNSMYRAVMTAYDRQDENNGYAVFAVNSGIDIRPLKGD